MFYALTGTVRKLERPHVAVETSGVAYLVSVPYPLWETLQDGKDTSLILYTYVREDRLDLFGFQSPQERKLFAELLNLSGVGPKLAMEICSIPRSMLIAAVTQGDIRTLTSIKGVGKKTAEKLLVDLKSLVEKHPEWATLPRGTEQPAAYDADAISALTLLGYDQASVLDALKKIPSKLKRTEDRVAAALRSL